jgi:hypothetical protein
MVIFSENPNLQVEGFTTGATVRIVGKFFDFRYSFAVNQDHGPQNTQLQFPCKERILACAIIWNKKMNKEHKEQDALLQ